MKVLVMAFDKAKYDLEYQRKFRKQFKAALKPEEVDDINNLLDKNKLNKAQFVRMAANILKKYRDIFFEKGKIEK